MTEATGVRADVWLDVACLFKTRSEAQRACKNGQVHIGGQPVKPHRLLQPGDQLTIRRPFGRLQIIVVRALADRSVARTEARQLYEDRTPPAAPEDLVRRRLERIHRAAMQAAGRPDKRQRRLLRRLKGQRD